MNRAVLLGVAFLALVLLWGLKQCVSPHFEPCAACDSVGSISCGAAGCERGKVTCNGPCLRKDTEGWQVANVPNSPPDLLWKPYYNRDGSTAWVSQRHFGQVMEEVNGTWVPGAPCKVCNGTTRMPCPACHAQKPCPDCGGSGQRRRWF